jgi:RHS repeat-associated protein
MVNAANGSIALNCEYGPFGELIRATGQLAKLTPLLFSTKYYDWETGLYYYGYRYYNPSTGKWLSRDPAGEQGGMNLYGLIGNDPINSFDLLDLLDYYLGSTDPTYTPPPTGQKPVSPTFGLKAERFAAAAAAGVASTEWPIAADLLEHYLSASGTPVSMDVYDMLDDSRSARDTYANELYEAKKFAATLAKKPNGDYDIDSRTLSQGEFSKSDNADWFYAIGRYASWGKGVAHVKDCKVTLEFTYEFRKRYQFQVDQDKYVSILGLKITDAQMGELQEAGLAKDFDISGSADRTVVVDITGDNPPGQTPPPGRTPGR